MAKVSITLSDQDNDIMVGVEVDGVPGDELRAVASYIINGIRELQQQTTTGEVNESEKIESLAEESKIITL